ncbi:MAG TPA: response regulator [Clostridia bacterium]|nr:response regulator [Clostridia bacterium]
MNKRVLILDDSRTIRTSVKYTLQKSGYEILLAENGVEGLEVLKENNSRKDRPQMIITDINMPKMNGIEFIKEVKKNREFKFIPILVLTTESQAEMKNKGKEAGAAGWLVKPFSPEQLTGVVKRFVR